MQGPHRARRGALLGLRASLLCGANEEVPGLRRELRRSREVTQVCSRKVTHQNGDLAQGKCAVWMARTARRLARGWDTKTLRAFGADEIATFTPCPRARPVLRTGHSIMS